MQTKKVIKRNLNTISHAEDKNFDYDSFYNNPAIRSQRMSI